MKQNITQSICIAILSVSWITLCSFLSSNINFNNNQDKPLKIIVLDAGHGGEDVGAKGKYSTEKDVSLAIALKTYELLKQELPDVQIVLTRDTDVFHSVIKKAQIANEAKGDLFVSIHCNSVAPIRHKELIGYKTVKRKGKTRKVPQYRYWTEPNPAKGTETYIWGIDKDDDKELAMKENESLYINGKLAEEVKDFDPYSPEKMILYSLKTKQFFKRSASLALTVEEEFLKVGRISREAKQRQKGIWVLQAVAMPAILVESGFISNPEEEDYLNSSAGQLEIARCITNAIKRYKYSLEFQLQQNSPSK